jgi:Tfp pilus assembly protein PilF
MTNQQQTPPVPPNKSDPLEELIKKFLTQIVVFTSFLAALLQVFDYIKEPRWWLPTVLAILGWGLISILIEKNTSKSIRVVVQITLVFVCLGIVATFRTYLVKPNDNNPLPSPTSTSGNLGIGGNTPLPNPSNPISTDAVAYLSSGNAHYEKDELDLALADYTQAIILNPKYAEAYNYRGKVYYKKNEAKLAIADFDLAIELNPKYAEAYNNRGLANSGGELFNTSAIDDFTKAIAFNPKYAEAYYNRGLAYYENSTLFLNGKDMSLAIDDYTQAIALNPKYAEAYYKRGDAYYNSGGGSYRDKGDLAKAVSDYKNAMALTNDPVMQQELKQKLREIETKP